MVHPDAVPQTIVYMDVKSIDFKVYASKWFTNKHEFIVSEHMLDWICTEATKSRFNIVSGRSDSDFDWRQTYIYGNGIWKELFA